MFLLFYGIQIQLNSFTDCYFDLICDMIIYINTGVKSTQVFSKISTNKGRIAQWIRARGYEPRSRGFKSLFARVKRVTQV